MQDVATRDKRGRKDGELDKGRRDRDLKKKIWEEGGTG